MINDQDLFNVFTGEDNVKIRRSVHKTSKRCSSYLSIEGSVSIGLLIRLLLALLWCQLDQIVDSANRILKKICQDVAL